MKSVRSLWRSPTSLPLTADDILEFHASRVLLLIHYCGSENGIDGLTKLAKLDFFVRYPTFFERVARYLGKDVPEMDERVESAMVRYHYGPWDKRYYQVLAYLEGRGLLLVEKHGQTFKFSISDLGKDITMVLGKQKAFASLVAQMKAVRKILGRKSGSQLKRLVYDVFDSEVKQLEFGELIR